VQQFAKFFNYLFHHNCLIVIQMLQLLDSKKTALSRMLIDFYHVKAGQQQFLASIRWLNHEDSLLLGMFLLIILFQLNLVLPIE
jgi:hypothetical protein